MKIIRRRNRQLRNRRREDVLKRSCQDFLRDVFLELPPVVESQLRTRRRAARESRCRSHDPTLSAAAIVHIFIRELCEQDAEDSLDVQKSPLLFVVAVVVLYRFCLLSCKVRRDSVKDVNVTSQNTKQDLLPSHGFNVPTAGIIVAARQ